MNSCQTGHAANSSPEVTIMAAEVQSPIPVAPAVHSQRVLPQHYLRLLALAEDYDGLWDRVNRICDQYMPKLFESCARPC